MIKLGASRSLVVKNNGSLSPTHYIYIIYNCVEHIPPLVLPTPNQRINLFSILLW